MTTQTSLLEICEEDTDFVFLIIMVFGIHQNKNIDLCGIFTFGKKMKLKCYRILSLFSFLSLIPVFLRNVPGFLYFPRYITSRYGEIIKKTGS